MQSKSGPIIDCNYNRARLRLLPHVTTNSSFPLTKSLVTSSDSIAMTCRKRRSYFSSDSSRKKLTASNLKAAAAQSSSVTKDDDNVEDEDPKLNPIYSSSLWRRFWKVAAPYWSSEDRAQARIQLAAVFALTLATTGISVGFNFLGRDFYNALSNKDADQFAKQLLYYLGGFAVGIPFFVLRDYARESLSLRWRSWMTSYYMERYLTDRTFYKIQSQSIIDNPDQRIVDDLSSFTATALSFSLTIFSTLVDLISFSNILFGIYPPLFLILLVYSIGGTAISVFLGKGLVSLNFMQEKKEADFRYGLVRVRENAESIAFYGGEDNELRLLLHRFTSAFSNLTQLLIASRNLDFFTSGYRYLIQILPAAVVAPMYFSGKIEFGVINQSVSAFNHILGDFSLIVYQFQAISAFSAVIDRLGEFDDVLDTRSAKSESSEERISLIYCGTVKEEEDDDPSKSEGNGAVGSWCQKLVEIEDLTLLTPTNKATLIKELSLQVNMNDNLLVTGASGSGKTSLLRAMAGLWDTGRGEIRFYVDEEEEEESKCQRNVFFLPQRPYMNLGTLRQQLLYPSWGEEDEMEQGGLPFLVGGSSRRRRSRRVGCSTGEEDLIKVLEDVRLEYIISRFNGIDSKQEWSSVLSLGEQQRLAFARLLLAKPKLVLLDESTSALDEANESHLYGLIRRAGITYISIGHRRTLYEYHSKCLHISSSSDESSGTTNCLIQSIPSS